jgi:hypothetical protein
MAFHYSPKIVTDGLEFYIDAANPKSYTSGSTLFNDLVGTKKLELNNGVLYTTDNLGSLEFDGIDDYCIDSEIYNMNKAEMTFDFWFKRYASNNTYNMVWNMYLPYFAFRSDNTFHFSRHTKIGGVATQRNLYSNNTFQNNVWYNVVCTNHLDVISGNNIVNMYVNGELEVSETVPNSVDTVFLSAVFNRKLGLAFWDVSNPRFFFEGKIPSLKIYNKILNADEVRQNYNALKTRFGL